MGGVKIPSLQKNPSPPLKAQCINCSLAVGPLQKKKPLC